jgi:hypothetical protein
MAWFEETSGEDRPIRVENKATEIRKLLLGALLPAKGVWKDDSAFNAASLLRLHICPSEKHTALHK